MFTLCVDFLTILEPMGVDARITRYKRKFALFVYITNFKILTYETQNFRTFYCAYKRRNNVRRNSLWHMRIQCPMDI